MQPEISLIEKDGHYWAVFSISCLQTKKIFSYQINTKYPSVGCYRKKALRKGRQIYKNTSKKVQNRFVKGGVNLVFSNREVHPSSLLENPMDLIRIRNNTIYLDFTYTCPNTATQKRHRKSTRLSDSLQNRILAQQQALTEFSALSQLHIPAQQSQSVNHSLSSTVVPSNANSVVVRMNVGDFVEYYKSRRKFRSCSKKTKRLYEIYINTYILPNFAHRCLTSIDADCLEDLEMQLIDEEKSPKYIRDIVGFFKMLLNFAVERTYLQSCPKYTLSSPKHKYRSTPKFLTTTERDILLKYVKDNESHYYPIVVLTVFTGLRLGEARSLTWSDVDLESKLPSVRVHKTLDLDGSFTTTKNKRERILGLHPKVVSVLLMVQQTQHPKTKDSDFVFLNRSFQTPLSGNTLHKMMTRSCERASVPVISFHGLRHTFATNIVNKHGIVKASKLLGHSDIKTTMMYYHADDETLFEALLDQ